jgi:uncharacterized protein (DUF1330 family)
MSASETVSEVLQALATIPDGQPVVMINLLRYRAGAVYPPGTETEPRTGRQAWEQYSQHMLPIFTKIGARPVFRAEAGVTLIGPNEARWDEVLIVEYPSRGAIEGMIASPEYQSAMIHRIAALEDARLIACTSPRPIGRLAWWWLKRSSKFRRP